MLLPANAYGVFEPKVVQVTYSDAFGREINLRATPLSIRWGAASPGAMPACWMKLRDWDGGDIIELELERLGFAGSRHFSKASAD